LNIEEKIQHILASAMPLIIEFFIKIKHRCVDGEDFKYFSEEQF
jgi:hypothetical protein